MSHVDLARTIAKIAHHGVVDKAGKPYFGHAHRVAMSDRLDFPVERAAGYLHDVVEDTPVTFNDLRRLGVTNPVLCLVATLTRRKDEAYFDYINRVGSIVAATKIKLADLDDNMDRSRWPDMPDSLMARYEKAKSILEEKLK